MPGSWNPSSQDAERQRQLPNQGPVDDPFLAGFLAGLAAANASWDVAVPDASRPLASDDPNPTNSSTTPWLFHDNLDALPNFPPSSTSTPQPQGLCPAISTTLSPPRGFSTGYEAHEESAAPLNLPNWINSCESDQTSAAPLDLPTAITSYDAHETSAAPLDLTTAITRSGINDSLLDFSSSALTLFPPLDDYGAFQASSGAANALAGQPSLATEGNTPLNQQLLPLVAISQHDWPALSEPQQLTSGPSESLHGNTSGSATNGDQLWNAADTHVLATTEAGALFRTGNRLHTSTPTAPEANLNGQTPGSATTGDQLWNVADTHVLATTEAGALVRTTNRLHASAATAPEANRNGQALILNASSLSVAGAPPVPKPSVRSGPPGKTKQLAKGAVQTVWRAYGSKRSKFNEQLRLGTAFTRDVGACEACRKKKLRCDRSSKEKFVPCGRCARLGPHLLPGPCCRVELVDIKLFRLGSAGTPAILQQWILSKEAAKGTLPLPDQTMSLTSPRRLYLAHDVTMTTFAVTVAPFEPGPDDATAYIWNDATGKKKEYVLPPYYITDMAEAGASMRRYVRTARPEFVQALLVNANPIVKKTFQEAERFHTASNNELVGDALMFWSATRMIERFWLICGPDMLGMPPMKENIGPCRRNHFVDSVPVTPVMDTQLDELAITEVLVPLKAKLLRLLKARVLAKKKEHWYEIYLASFIILHNAERVLDHVVDFGRRFGVSPEPKSNQESSLSHAYYHACKTVLAYFHFASGGAAPLALDWIGPARDTSIMSEAQVAYLRDITAEMVRQDAQLKTLKDASMYETELYWCHQMLSPGWKADMPHSGKLLEFTEKDFLVS